MTPAQRVFATMRDGAWRTLAVLMQEAGVSRAQAESAIASFGTAKMGGHYVERQGVRTGGRVSGYQYRLHLSKKYAQLK